MDYQEYEKLDQPEVLKVLFHPRKASEGEPPAGAVDLDFTVDEDVQIGGRFYPADVEAPNILFFHGIGEIVSDYDTVGPKFNEFGMSFLAVDYRGYGRSTGLPTVSAMIHDAHSIFNQVKSFLKDENRNGPFILMGRSLGSVCAIELAATCQDDIAALIIESGIATTMPLLQNMGIDTTGLGITEQDGFRNIRKIAQVFKPIFVLHARHDQLISIANAELLQAESGARNKQFQVVPGADHNTIMAVAGNLYFETIKQFINKILGIKPRWKRKRSA
jgi:alpha-beta hydrolase superfamily lysophospholipase